jgi:hypothetical protein
MKEKRKRVTDKVPDHYERVAVIPGTNTGVGLPPATFEQIRRRAFEICRKRGNTEDPGVLDWFKAERELNSEAYMATSKALDV